MAFKINRCQITIESLLLFAAMLAMLSVSFAIYSELESKSRLAIDLESARHFAAQVKNAEAELNAMGDGAMYEVRASPKCRWAMPVLGNSFIQVDCGKEKSIVKLLGADGIPSGTELTGKFSIMLVKSGGKVSAILRQG